MALELLCVVITTPTQNRYKFLQSLKMAKRRYRETHRQVRDSQLQVQTCSRDVVAAKVDLYKRFNDWYPRNASRETLVRRLEAHAPGGGHGHDDDNDELLDASEQFDKVEMQVRRRCPFPHTLSLYGKFEEMCEVD